MRKAIVALTVSVLAGVAPVAQQSTTPAKPVAKGAAGNQATIRLAMSGAPADIAENATIVDIDDKGQMRQLRAGTNGWTCMPSAGGASGAAGANPMCLDKTWMVWADAWMHKTAPPSVTTVGVAYMLRGNKGASNTDPFAQAPTATNQWVVSPPHVMVLVPDKQMLDAFPTDPHNGRGWVMWKGTPYVHIMMPIPQAPTTK